MFNTSPSRKQLERSLSGVWCLYVEIDESILLGMGLSGDMKPDSSWRGRLLLLRYGVRVLRKVL